MKEDKYGLTINDDGTIDVFEFESDQSFWQNRIGYLPDEGELQTDQFYDRLRTFQEDEDATDVIIAHYFDRSVGSLTILAQDSGLNKVYIEPIYEEDGSLQLLNFEWKDNTEVLLELNLQPFFNVKFDKIDGFGDWVILSKSTYQEDRGLVVITSSIHEHMFHLSGQEGNYFGEQIWISGEAGISYED